jgi:acyl-CoA hydrolase
MTSPTQVTEEQAAFIEEKTKAIFDYTIDCLDRARSEANNLLQWYFGAIAGGVALASELRTEGFVVLAIGVATAVAAAATFACLLISEMKSRFTTLCLECAGSSAWAWMGEPQTTRGSSTISRKP